MTLQEFQAIFSKEAIMFTIELFPQVIEEVPAFRKITTDKAEYFFSEDGTACLGMHDLITTNTKP